MYTAIHARKKSLNITYAYCNDETRAVLYSFFLTFFLPPYPRSSLVDIEAARVINTRRTCYVLLLY